MSIVVRALVVLALALVAGCDADRRAISRDDLPDVGSEPSHVVVLDDDGFDPDSLVVATDELVEFRVEGDTQRGIRTEDHEIDTGLLVPGESTFAVFDQEGSYAVIDLADDGHVLDIEARPAER